MDTIKSKPANFYLRNAIIFCIAGCGTGIFVALFVYQVVVAKLSVNWPQTNATILSSRVDRGIAKSHSLFFPKIVYEYTIEGKEFTSERINFGDPWGGKEAEAEKVREKYPVGSSVLIHYSQQNPNEAVIMPGVITDDLFNETIFSAFGVFIWFCISIYFLKIHRRRK